MYVSIQTHQLDRMPINNKKQYIKEMFDYILQNNMDTTVNGTQVVTSSAPQQLGNVRLYSSVILHNNYYIQ